MAPNDYKEMNKTLPDLQNCSTDFIKKPIFKVGITNYSVPIRLFYPPNETYFNTIATVSSYVGLDSTKKGVNMSRFSETITESVKDKITSEAINEMLIKLKTKLETETAFVKLRFNYLMKVIAPESKLESWFNIPIVMEGKIDSRNNIRKFTTVEVNYTSCCPCSAEISKYGAHNQRSMARITVEQIHGVSLYFEELKEIVDKSSSCPVYNILKRIDEKHVTERAYENPKFSEDTCREISVELDKLLDVKISDYCIVVENFESIHQSNAVSVLNAGRELN